MESSAENQGEKNQKMALWNMICTTNPKYTTQVSLGNRKFTAIDAYYQFRKMTQFFGPFGIGWGVDECSFKPFMAGKLVLFTGRMWYMWDGARGEIPIQSAARTVLGKEERLDDDCIKKVVTDAITKGASMLGLNADVFLGFFENNKYLSELRRLNEANPESQRPDIPPNRPRGQDKDQGALAPSVSPSPEQPDAQNDKQEETEAFIKTAIEVSSHIGQEAYQAALKAYSASDPGEIRAEDRKAFFADIANFAIRTSKLTPQTLRQIIAKHTQQPPPGTQPGARASQTLQ